MCRVDTGALLGFRLETLGLKLGCFLPFFPPLAYLKLCSSPGGRFKLFLSHTERREQCKLLNFFGSPKALLREKWTLSPPTCSRERPQTNVYRLRSTSNSLVGCLDPSSCLEGSRKNQRHQQDTLISSFPHLALAKVSWGIWRANSPGAESRV